MLDLSKLAAALETKHEVIHPTLGRTGWVVSLAGDDHPATKDAVRRMLDKRGRRKHSSPEQDEQDGLDLLAARTLGWEGLNAEYSDAKAREVFSMEGMSWLRRQLLEAMGDEAGFFAK